MMSSIQGLTFWACWFLIHAGLWLIGVSKTWAPGAVAYLLFKTHLKLNPLEISFVYNIDSYCSIVLKFCMLTMIAALRNAIFRSDSLYCNSRLCTVWCCRQVSLRMNTLNRSCNAQCVIMINWAGQTLDICTRNTEHINNPQMSSMPLPRNPADHVSEHAIWPNREPDSYCEPISVDAHPSFTGDTEPT